MPVNPRHQGREGGPALMAVALDASEFPKVGTTQPVTQGKGSTVAP